VAGFLGLVWFISSLVSAFFIIHPKESWAIVRTRGRAAAVFAACFLGLPTIAAAVTPPPDSAVRPSSQKVDIGQDATENPEKYLKLSEMNASKSGFGMIVVLDGTVRNGAPIWLKDPMITCTLFSESDTNLGEVSQTLYKKIKPHGTISFSSLNMGFGDSNWEKYSCRISRAAVPN
jgi:hypothetical protein